MKLNLFTEIYVVCKLNDDAQLGGWLKPNSQRLIMAAQDEYGKTVVCSKEYAEHCDRADDVQCQTEWRCFQVDGILDFDMVGIMAELSGLMNNVGISVYAISSFETDYLMVMKDNVDKAVEAFENSGHTVIRLINSN